MKPGVLEIPWAPSSNQQLRSGNVILGPRRSVPSLLEEGQKEDFLAYHIYLIFPADYLQVCIFIVPEDNDSGDNDFFFFLILSLTVHVPYFATEGTYRIG